MYHTCVNFSYFISYHSRKIHEPEKKLTMAPSSSSGNSNDEDNLLASSINTAQSLNSPAISALTDPSVAAASTSTAQIQSISTGIPKTPERRQILVQNINEGEEGYDSDGQPAPWVDNEEEVEGFEVAIEVTVPDKEDNEVGHGGDGPSPNPTNTSLPVSTNVLSIEDMMKLKVLELRSELKRRNLSVFGKKGELRNRLRDAIERNLPVIKEVVTEEGGGSNNQRRNNALGAGNGFDHTARWELLEQDGDEINEDRLRDAGEGISFRAPTEPENEGRGEYALKRNYSHQFDRAVFTATAKVPVLKGRWKQLSYDEDDNVQYENAPVEETIPNVVWCEAKGLDIGSHPAEWFNAFLPVKNRRHGGGPTNFTIENVLSWTNTKARMMNAGLGGKYSDFVDFSLIELMKHIGLYLFHGISPSPQVEMKFKSSAEDVVNGNDFICRAFGG
jgi:hypothetical protein